MARPDPKIFARTLFDVGVRAADPARAVRQALQDEPLEDLDGGRYLIIAFGKAAVAMTTEVLRHLPQDAVFSAVVVTNYENHREIPGCTVLAAGHPIPDENGLKAGRVIQHMLLASRSIDFVLCLISGGGSALVPTPWPGITLEDKARVNEILLEEGFDISEINLVRQNISMLKGGGLSRFAAPAKVRSLIISDVIGDDVRVIASGPTAPQIGTGLDAIERLKGKGVWDKIPPSVHSALLEGEEKKMFDIESTENAIICSNKQSLTAMASYASDWSPRIVTDHLVGDVARAADDVVAQILAVQNSSPCVLLWGGETTVNVKGTGKGGRNQELALRVASQAERLPGNWCFLSGGTDGRDGPTSAAGGLVDRNTISRIRAVGQDIEKLLSSNDSHFALRVAGDLLSTGATGTNVADLQIFVRA